MADERYNGERKPHGGRSGDKGGRSARRDDGGRSGASRPTRGHGAAGSGSARLVRKDDRHGSSDSRPRHDDPVVPNDVEPRDLDSQARVQLKTLTKENADWVARHLVMAGRLIEEDPQLAHRHALAASRKAGRVALVRETVGLTAYEIGDFALALRELRTFRRISGLDTQVPVMVDSERGLGRPNEALELGRSVDRSSLDAETQVELAIAMSGARLDLGQDDRALEELQIPQLDPNTAFSYSPRLFRAYAEVLTGLGREHEAAEWQQRARIAEEALGLAPAEDDSIEIVDLGDEADASN